MKREISPNWLGGEYNREWLDEHERIYGEIPSRAYSILARLNLEGGEDLEKYTYNELLKIRNCGRKTMRDIQKVASCYGVSIHKTPNEPTPLQVQRSRITKTEARIKLMLIYRFKNGLTLAEIGEIFEISKVAVSQIINKELELHKAHERIYCR